MTEIEKIELNWIDWHRVRLITVDGCTIRLVTEAGAQEFHFKTEAEAAEFLEASFKTGAEHLEL